MIYTITVEQLDGSETVYTRNRIKDVRTLVSFIQGGTSAQSIVIDKGKRTTTLYVREHARWREVTR